MSSSIARLWAKAQSNPATNPKTIHFWAPVLKWGIVIAGINDFGRPVEQLSVTQNVALFATGSIWTRWCLIISPINKPLASVNAFLAVVGGIQLSRIASHKWAEKKKAEESAVTVAK